MARVRVVLLGPLAEFASDRELELAAHSVREVLELVRARFGPDFARLLVRSRSFVNGEDAEEATVLIDGDEVALVPPVSGG